jgi:hypothetical protein
MDFIIGVKDIRFQVVLSQNFEVRLLDAPCGSFLPNISIHQTRPNNLLNNASARTVATAWGK